MPVAQSEQTGAPSTEGIMMVKEVVIGGGACLRSIEMRLRPDRPGVIQTLMYQSASP